MIGQLFPGQAIQFGDVRPPYPGLKAKVGSFNTGTGAVSSTVAVTDVGFKPKAILFFWSGDTGTTDTVGGKTTRNGRGFATGPTERSSETSYLQDGADPTVTYERITDNSCVQLLLNSTTLDGSLDFQSFDDGGFTLVVDDQFSTSYRIHYLALGGPGIKAKAGVGEVVGGSAGNQDYTGFGFNPSLVLMCSGGLANLDTIGAGGVNSLGAIVSGSSALITAAARNNQTSTTSICYCRVGEYCWAYSTDYAPTLNRNASGSLITDGFRLNVTGPPSSGVNIKIPYLVLGGLAVKLDKVSTRTDGNDIVASSFGFKPKAALFVSGCRAESAAGTADADINFSIGVATGPGERRAAAIFDRSAVGAAQDSSAIEHDEIYANISTSDAIEGLMDVKSFDADGFTLVMDDADPSAAMVWYVAMG